VERPVGACLPAETYCRFGSILLKNSVSAQRRKISRDMPRFDRGVPRGYRPKAFASPGPSLFCLMKNHWRFSLAMLGVHENSRIKKPSFSTE
jgi:hypothetical protein